MHENRRDGSYAHGGIHYLDLADDSRKRQIEITKDTEKRLEKLFGETAKELAQKAASARQDSLTERFMTDYIIYQVNARSFEKWRI